MIYFYHPPPFVCAAIEKMRGCKYGKSPSECFIDIVQDCEDQVFEDDEFDGIVRLQ